jgi:hypothetical protein
MRRVGQNAAVEDEPEPTAWPQHAVDLRDRHVVIEPVKRLCDENGVGGGVRQRDSLGRPGHCLRSRSNPPQNRPHPIRRLDRHDARAGLEQRHRELAGAGGKVGDGPTGAEVEHAREPLDRLPWVARTDTVVLLGRGIECPGGWVDAHLVEISPVSCSSKRRAFTIAPPSRMIASA